MKIIHILRSPNDTLALETLNKQSEHMEVTVILLQDAISVQEISAQHLFVLEEGICKDRIKETSIRSINYRDFLNLIFEHDKVLCW